MKNFNILRNLIKEELTKVFSEGESAMENYMFFQNLQTIHKATGEMLQMDPEYVDSVLSNGHQWAVDHIATSADDVGEVHTFLANRQPLIEELDPKRDMLNSIRDSVNYLLSWELSTIGLTPQQNQMLTKVAVFLRELVDNAEEGSSEAGSVEEKKLTKAELKKREEVAKGIKKSDPKMPMDKKMAIATAVAKKVAEAKKGFTSKYDNDPKLKGKQKNLPDALQAKITKSK
jgi:hypothetical protein